MLHMLKKHMTQTIIEPGDSFKASTKAWFPAVEKINKIISKVGLEFEQIVLFFNFYILTNRNIFLPEE